MAVEVDVLVGERGEVLDLAGRDQLAGGAELVEDALGGGLGKIGAGFSAKRSPSVLDLERVRCSLPVCCRGKAVALCGLKPSVAGEFRNQDEVVA